MVMHSTEWVKAVGVILDNSTSKDNRVSNQGVGLLQRGVGRNKNTTQQTGRAPPDLLCVLSHTFHRLLYFFSPQSCLCVLFLLKNKNHWHMTTTFKACIEDTSPK